MDMYDDDDLPDINLLKILRKCRMRPGGTIEIPVNFWIAGGFVAFLISALGACTVFFLFWFAAFLDGRSGIIMGLLLPAIFITSFFVVSFYIITSGSFWGITIDADGLTHKSYGFIPWESIHQITVADGVSNTFGGGREAKMLLIRIRKPKDYISDIPNPGKRAAAEKRFNKLGTPIAINPSFLITTANETLYILQSVLKKKMQQSPATDLKKKKRQSHHNNAIPHDAPVRCKSRIPLTLFSYLVTGIIIVAGWYYFFQDDEKAATTAMFPPVEVVVDTLTDSRDGQKYRTVKIDGRTWMAQNLNFKTDNSRCFGDSEGRCQIYGRLYDWNSAMSACPAGWRLPASEDWGALEQAAGGKKVAAKRLKSQFGWGKWLDSGTDVFGFSALPGGFRNSNGRYTSMPYRSTEVMGYWWTATTDPADGKAYFRRMQSANAYTHAYRLEKVCGMSVRCVRDAGSVEGRSQ